MAVAAGIRLCPAEEQLDELELTTGLLVQDQDDDEEDDLDDDDAGGGSRGDGEGEEDDGGEDEDSDYRRWDEDRPGWSD